MSVAAVARPLKPSSILSWRSTGKLQQTVAECIERSGQGLHSGDISTVKILPAAAGVGRSFLFRSTVIPASIDYALKETPLCTTLSKDGYGIRTAEHLLSALEASGVDNCHIEVEGTSNCDRFVEIPIFDGSAREWVEAIEQTGLKVAVDYGGKNCEKLAPYLNEPVHVLKNDAFIAAFPCSKVNITYGIDYPQAPAIGRQWFSSTFFDESFYSKQIALSRTFCIYEEVEHMRGLGLIKGGSAETAIVCSMSKGWLNPPLRYNDEPCRHKVLDLIGDVSLLAEAGNQGLLVAHIVAYKAGHSLHTEFVRRLTGIGQESHTAFAAQELTDVNEGTRRIGLVCTWTIVIMPVALDDRKSWNGAYLATQRSCW